MRDLKNENEHVIIGKMPHHTLKKSYTKPLPYIKELAKNIGIIRKQKPHWDIFQVVAVVQRIMRSKKYRCPHN